ncbi:hypothetical protein NF865_07175 [Thermococcus aggregans]|uniref:Uncharacterized protein n=1 Tax=Thermococcus aggregans TaxID=110163 RepID=A0A9E7MWK0_THEAG|nr:hypothetical protein [Thermococcus aggregans]USS40114.1 hypothetical protein NF865_07175 [Thermococcus aggregans]
MFLTEVNKRLDELGISWLRFSLQSSKFMKKKSYGLKILVKWDKFIEFVESFSSDPSIQVWEKYQYISSSRLPVLVKMLPRGEEQYEYFKRAQNRVRMLCSQDIEVIENKLSEIRTMLNAMQKKLWRISKKEELPLAMLAYLLEARVVIETIRQIAKEGLFPSCYRELRKFLENFSWAFFGDYLLTKAYKRHGLLYHNYAFIASKGWYEWIRKNNNELILNTTTARKKIDNLHKKLKQTYSSLPGKDKFWSTFMSEITFPSFIFLFGEEVNGETLPMEVPRYPLSEEIVQYALKDFENIGESLGLPNPEAFGEGVVKTVMEVNKTSKSAFIVPPYPANDLVLMLVEKWGDITKLNKKYEEYSTFVHSYIDSWVVLPFSSVMEVKVFKKEIADIKNLVKELCRAYLNIFKAKSQHSSKKKV